MNTQKITFFFITFVHVIFPFGLAFSAELADFDFELYSIEDVLVNTREIRNLSSTKYLIVDFFSLDCIPCKKALPDLDRFISNNSDKGVDIIIVAVLSSGDKKEESKSISAYLKSNKYKLKTVIDKYNDIALKYGVDNEDKLQVPNLFLLNKNGDKILQSSDHLTILKRASELLPPLVDVKK